MKKILFILALGITVLCILTGCHKDKTTTKQTTIESKPTTTEVKTTTEQKTTVKQNVDPWYEDEYREISYIHAQGDTQEDEYYHKLIIMGTTTVKMSETETITAFNVTSCWGYSDGSTRGDIAYQAYYYNPVQKKVKVVHVGLKGFNYELGTDIYGTTYINYLEFDSYFEDQCYEEYIDVSNKTISYLEYLEEN